ncbi:MAG: hypothetical protein U1F43_30035 [Myxococcota bacterium]
MSRERQTDAARPSEPWVHFSVDDVFDALVEAGALGSVFEHPFFALLAEAHARFGTRTDLYLFQAGDVGGARRTLADVPSRLRAELEPLEWLRFGPHALDAATPPYTQRVADQEAVFGATFAEIDRFAGRARRSAAVRLHYFSEAYEAAPHLLAEGVRTLFLTDRDAVSYRLPSEARARLAETGRVEHAGLELLRSHARVEDLDPAIEVRADDALARHGYFALFTHERELARPEVRAHLFRTLEHLARRVAT